MLMDGTSGQVSGAKSRLLSPEYIAKSSSVCMEFYYHMKDDSNSATFQIMVSIHQGAESKIFEKIGDQGMF